MADSLESAESEPDTSKPLTLGQRLIAIRRECAGIGKEDIKMQNKERTKSWTIKAHTVEGVLAGVRPLLDKHGVLLLPQLKERAYTGNRCDILIEFTFSALDGDSTPIVINWAGSGTDNADKGFAKAGTNALKEMLKKVFLITDRDDAKEEDAVEYEPNEGVTRYQVDELKDAKRKALENTAHLIKEALENAKSDKDVLRIQRKNREYLSSDDTPGVTKTFFAELIARRRKELE